ncbi:MAG: toprim domain-containing protein [Selenomonadaceae bacterium]|nr:toprim domain-containing protein [Selenomonadaceae bacterium]
MKNSIFNEIKKFSPQDLENAGVIRIAKTRANGYPTYECPICGNGGGKSGDGLTVKEYAWGYNYHCFGGCGGKNYTAVDLIAAHCGYRQTEMEKVAEWAKDNFHNLLDFSYFIEKNQKATVGKQVTEKVSDDMPKDYGKFQSWSQSQLEGFIKSQGGKFRGLTLEDYKEVGGGYSDGKIILPYDKFHYFERSVSDSPKIKKHHGKKEKLYNPYGADFQKSVMVVEGEIDCLSIHKATDGKIPVVAIGGAGEYRILLSEIEKIIACSEVEPKFVLMFDDDGAGQENAKKALSALKSAGYAAVSVILSKDLKFDANEFLQRDQAGLRERLFEIYFSAGKELEKLFAQIDGEKYGCQFGNYFKLDFSDEVNAAANYSERQTHFANLDKEQIFLPGLYVIGGLSALGKTTFVWQILEQMATSGECCVFCSYEMSRLEMFAKSMSREVYRRESENYTREVLRPLTSAAIRRGNFGGEHTETFFEVMSEFSESKKNLRVLELSDESVDELLEKLRKICARTKKPPIISVDYLQIIPSTRYTTKQAVDDTVRKLKNFQRETNTTFLVISSINRVSYGAEIAFESFKESGNIEFSADVVWGLQLYFEYDSDRQNKNKIEEAKKLTPRKIHLKCLKNRSGGNYECYFKYYSAVDTFIGCEKSDFDEGMTVN